MNTLLRDTHPPHTVPGCDATVECLGLEGYDFSWCARPAVPQVSAEITRIAEESLQRHERAVGSGGLVSMLDLLYLVSPFSFVLRDGHRLPRAQQVARELDRIWWRIDATPSELYPVELHTRHLFFASCGLTARQASRPRHSGTKAALHRPDTSTCPTCQDQLSHDPLAGYVYELERGPSIDGFLAPEICCATCGDAFARRTF